MSQALIAALQNPALYPHPVEGFQVIETHISWVLLTGPYAYKIKKPVNFGFLDFTELDDANELYDLENDPYELKNLINDPKAKPALDRMKAELARLLSETSSN